MNKFICQTRSVFLKNMNMQLRKSKLFVHLSVPIICGLLLWVALLDDMKSMVKYASIIILPFTACGVIRSNLMMIVNEKKDRQKENQLIMGLKLSSYYLGWILSCIFLTILCSSTYVVLFFGYYLFINANYPFSEYVFFYIQYMLYAYAITGQMFFISSLFMDGRKATEVYSAIFVTISFLYFLTEIDVEDTFTKTVVIIFPQTLLIYYQWEVMFLMEYGNVIGMFETWRLFILQGTVGLLLYLYFDQVLPNIYGTSKHPLFFLKCFKRNKQRVQLVEVCYELQQQQFNIGAELLNPQEQFESEEASENSIVKLTQLTKIYDGESVVNHLNLNIYKNQIFCLLGHNGAGKSTTINMICGLIEKESGRITINNLDIETNLDEISQSLGFCSQKDVLYPDMTVYDHLQYYGEIKMIKQLDLSSHIEYLLDVCQLQQEKHQLGMYLSGGGKRKLCLAIALIGKSSVLLLDEPTTGLDPISRQQIWSILREVKKDRCIILTTHYLDEAQELADRVGIIQSGKLTVYGTVDYIKRQFSVGYNISIECKDEEHQIQTLEQIKPQINTLCQKEIKYQVQNRLIRLNIPLGNDQEIASVLEYLESIKSIALAFEMTSLEDAYIKIHTDSEFSNQNIEENINYNEMFADIKPSYNFYNQLKGLVLRRIWIANQNKWQYLLFMLVWIMQIGVLVGSKYERY